MTGMVEKVAIAIFCARENDTQEMWDRSRGPWKDEYRQQARAAIEAMKEPTEEMVITGAYVLDQKPSEAKTTYTAMIDAALKEEAQ